MPAGDARRVWFPELVEMLRSDWKESGSIDDLIVLRDRLNEELHHIRTSRGIKPPMMWCRKCQAQRRQAEPCVSVYAAIFALKRFTIAEPAVVKDLERAWNRHRRKYDLDLYGKEKCDAKAVHTH